MGERSSAVQNFIDDLKKLFINSTYTREEILNIINFASTGTYLGAQSVPGDIDDPAIILAEEIWELQRDIGDLSKSLEDKPEAEQVKIKEIMQAESKRLNKKLSELYERVKEMKELDMDKFYKFQKFLKDRTKRE